MRFARNSALARRAAWAASRGIGDSRTRLFVRFRLVFLIRIVGLVLPLRSLPRLRRWSPPIEGATLAVAREEKFTRRRRISAYETSAEKREDRSKFAHGLSPYG